MSKGFGGINHNLLIDSLKIHHIHAEIIQLITSLYSDYDISILTDNSMTSPIKVQRGILQGDSLLLLLFSLIVNTLINTTKFKKANLIIRIDKYHTFGIKKQKVTSFSHPSQSETKKATYQKQ